MDLSFSSSSWGLGRAAVCDCGIPWTFLLPFLNLSKALGPDEFHPRPLKEFAIELGPVFAHLFQTSLDKGENSQGMVFG